MRRCKSQLRVASMGKLARSAATAAAVDQAGTEELQAWSDERVLARSRRRRCPATGTSVFEAYGEERRHLGPLPILPEPFDVVVTRPVGIDCMVAFEGRSYSVPFRYVGQRVEVRGCAGRVQVLADAQIVSVHPRGTDRRLLIDARHFEGEASDEILPPLPRTRERDGP